MDLTDNILPEEEWQVVQKNIKKPKIYPIHHFWDGYDLSGKERWFIELNDGRIIYQKDPEFSFWLKKYRPKFPQKIVI